MQEELARMSEVVFEPIARAAVEQSRLEAQVAKCSIEASKMVTLRQQELDDRDLAREHSRQLLVGFVAGVVTIAVVGVGLWMLVVGNPLGWSLVTLVVGGAGGFGVGRNTTEKRTARNVLAAPRELVRRTEDPTVS